VNDSKEKNICKNTKKRGIPTKFFHIFTYISRPGEVLVYAIKFIRRISV